MAKINEIKIIGSKSFREEVQKDNSIKEVSLDFIYNSLKVSKITLRLEGRDYLVDIEHLIRVGNFNDTNDETLMNILEEISAFRLTVAVSQAELEGYVESLSNQFDYWYSSVADPIKENYLLKQKSITDKQLLGLVLKNYFTQYSEYKEKISLYKKRAEILKGLQFILHQRVEVLDGLLEKRGVKRGRGAQGTF